MPAGDIPPGMIFNDCLGWIPSPMFVNNIGNPIFQVKEIPIRRITIIEEFVDIPPKDAVSFCEAEEIAREKLKCSECGTLCEYPVREN